MSEILRGKRWPCSDASFFSTAVSGRIVVWFGSTSRVVLASPNQTRAIYRFTRPLDYCLVPAVKNICQLLSCDKRINWVSQLIMLRPAGRHYWPMVYTWIHVY